MRLNVVSTIFFWIYRTLLNAGIKKAQDSIHLSYQFFPLLWRRHPDSNWRIKVLQTSALPLGYGAPYVLTGI